MKVGNYALYDKVQGVYMHGVQLSSDVLFKRTIEIAVARNQLGDTILRHPEEFFGVQIGSFDNEFGVWLPDSPKVLWCVASLFEDEKVRSKVDPKAVPELQDVLFSKVVKYELHMEEEDTLRQARVEVANRIASGVLEEATVAEVEKENSADVK